MSLHCKTTKPGLLAGLINLINMETFLPLAKKGNLYLFFLYTLVWREYAARG
jgi:hypothetical protein